MSEILLNETITGLQHQAAVTSLRGQQYLVLWSDGSDASIKGRRVLPSGNAIGGELRVSRSTPAETNVRRELPAVQALGVGAAASWIERGVDGSSPPPQVKLQPLDEGGRPVGAEVQVTTEAVEAEHRPSLGFMVDGGCVVAWSDRRPEKRLRARLFNSDGSPRGGEIAVNTAPGFHERPVVIGLPEGFVVAWRSDPSPPGGGRLTLRLFDFDGEPSGDEQTPNLVGFREEKAMELFDEQGRFAVAHIKTGPPSDLGVEQSSVEVRVFEPDGTFSDLSLVSGGHGVRCSSPSIARLPGARLLVAWVQQSAETTAEQPTVRARVLSFAGESSRDVQVNTTMSENMFTARASTAFGGGEGETALVVWVDDSRSGGDTSDLAVRGQVLRIDSTGGLVAV